MTLRLLRTAESEWDSFDGWCASQRIDPWKLPTARMLSLIYYWATRYADENQHKKFDRRLWIPPKGYEPEAESPWSAANEMSGFRGLAADMNVTVAPAST